MYEEVLADERGPRVPRSRGPKVPGSQGPGYLKLTFKYKLDSKEGPSCSSLLSNVFYFKNTLLTLWYWHNAGQHPWVWAATNNKHFMNIDNLQLFIIQIMVDFQFKFYSILKHLKVGTKSLYFIAKLQICICRLANNPDTLGYCWWPFGCWLICPSVPSHSDLSSWKSPKF